MRFTNWLFVGLLLSIASLDSVFTYQTFRDKIPNGLNVPHPCNSSEIWNGVGHRFREGGGERNRFGLAFFDNGKVWNETLCRLDSDGDGKTNGAELGDPDCTWTSGNNPDITDRKQLSHPGICEPLNSKTCKDANQGINVDCGKPDICKAMKDEDVVKHTIQFPDSPVPVKETTYMCMQFEFPQDDDYHMVAVDSHIGNINVIHHILIYGCEDPSENKSAINEPYECFMGDLSGCNSIVAVWAFGMSATCFHPNAGIRVGSSDKGFKTGILQVHWNNPEFLSGQTDNSGLDLYLTATRRPYDAGVLMYGQGRLVIPPKKDRHSIVGKCSSMCTKEYMKGPVNITGVFNHMHNLGKAAESSLTSPGNRVYYLGNDEHYDYNSPVYHSLTEEREMRPGDELSLTCHYNSSTRSKTTYWGESTSQEMCYTFVMYYPKENFKASICQATGDIGPCELDKPLLRNCNLTALIDYLNHPDILKIYVDIAQNCRPLTCLKECMDIVKQVKKHPCFSDDVKQLIFNDDEMINPSLPPEAKAYFFDNLLLFSRLQSCDTEFALEEERRNRNDKGPVTGSAPRLSAAVTVVIAMMLYEITQRL